MFNLSMPYDNDHPLFRLEVRRIRWGKSPRQLRRYSLWTIAIVALLLLILWPGASWKYSTMYWFLNDLLNYNLMLIFFGIAANVVLDMTCLLLTLNTIDMRERKVWWELVRLTLSGVQDVIAVRYAVAQVRAWRVMMVVVAMRIVAVVFALAYVLLDWLTNSTEYINATTILFIPTLVVCGGTYILEPLWRMRAVTALGVRISAQTSHAALAILNGFGVIIVVWVSQFVSVGFLGVFFLLIVSIINRIFFGIEWSIVAIACEVFGLSVTVALGIYFYYHVMSSGSLQQALRQVRWKALRE